MSNNNILINKVNNVIKNKSQLESNFPKEFEHMKNINIKIITKYNYKLIIQYDDSYECENTIEFKIRCITDNGNIILHPQELIGSSHIQLIENNGPFIIKR